ncbi:MAG: NADH-quinone oxidoreductase subunit L [Bacteroidales bacterium]|nr:NADH-quinone oxidoreductase subunit L [Bacteroidales bacterium]
MTAYIPFIPAIPLFSSLIIILFGKILSKRVVAFLGVGSVSLSALITIIAGISFISSPPASGSYTVTVWNWLTAGGFSANIAFSVDALSLIFCFVITFVGALIHLYSVEFMDHDEGFARFFAYMNLFVSSMLILVLADNLLLMYLGWEGVGLCSYLLIGFWYKEPENGYAARKAFIVTRVGDTAMIIGLFLLFINLGTLNINELMQQASLKWAVSSPLAILSAALLLGGALGKSAQLPLQTWLPDAMAGPSPVSALIHAATMVTAGVYLIARTHVLFALAPAVQAAVAIIGAATLIVAGFSALTQHDFKRVLAYSTISQIGYMFLALGVGAWSAAVFHFMIHAFFKALLFLGAGAVIHLLHHEHDMFKMGGLWKKLPIIFITFLIGSASLAALPLISAGFYSKDAILWFAWSSTNGSKWLWLAAYFGAFITSIYTFRMIFVTFFGEAKTEPTHKPGKLMTIPLVVLAILSLIGGFIELPENFGHFQIFSKFLSTTLPSIQLAGESHNELLFQILSAVASLLGIYLAYLLYFKKSSFAKSFSNSQLANFFYKGWQFDWLYDRIFVKPLVWFSEINKNDFIDKIYTAIAKATDFLNSLLSRTQQGRLRWYVMVLTAGVVIILTFMLNL